MIRTLRIFRDLVNTRSFTKTAHLNFLTQSAVSQQIKLLEETFGATLITRGKGEFELTSEGKLVHETAKEILLKYDGMVSTFRDKQLAESQALRIGSIYTAGLYTLPPYVASFMRAFPTIKVQLRYLSTPEIYECILADSLNIGIVDHLRPDKHLTSELFKKEKIVVIVSPQHPWAEKHEISLAEFEGQPLIMPESELYTHHIIHQKPDLNLNIAHRFENIELAKRAVEAGLGFSLAPQLTVEQEVQTGRLRSLKLKAPVCERSIWILYRSKDKSKGMIQQFTKQLREPLDYSTL